MATTTKSKKTTSGPLVALLMAGAVISVLVLIVAGKVLLDQALLNNRILNKKTAALKTLEANVASFPRLRSEYDGLGDKRDFIATSLPAAPNFEDISASFELMAAQSGVKLRSLSPGVAATGSSTNNGVAELRFAADIEGPAAAITTFLQAVEVSSRPLRVESMNIRATTTTVSASLSILTFYQQPVDYKLGTETVK